MTVMDSGQNVKNNYLKSLESEQKQADSGKELAYGRWKRHEENFLFIMAFELRVDPNSYCLKWLK